MSNKETTGDDKCQACHGTGSVAGAGPVRTGPFLLNPPLCRCWGYGPKATAHERDLAALRNYRAGKGRYFYVVRHAEIPSRTTFGTVWTVNLKKRLRWPKDTLLNIVLSK
jgi:hypothetical protein